MMRKARAAALALVLLAPGCTWFRRAPKAAPTPQPPSPDILKPVPKPKPRVLEPPASPPVTTPQEVPSVNPPLPETARPAPVPPPAAKPVPRPSRRRPQPPAESKKPDAIPASPPVSVPAESPRLGEVLDPEQRKQAEKSYYDNLGLARQAIDVLARRSLSRDQQDTLARARTFLQQAESMAGSDITTAAQLVRRANLLARDLLNNLR